MAFYDDNTNVKKTDKSEKYQKKRSPGETPPGPGIYKCQECGFEDVINRECETLPPCSNCEGKGVKWKWLVRATNE
ncbi:MAG: hypothetical protein H7Z12_19380 [Rhodospirillaceae bacterium]|nr:hypothetical protein [Rhodospirillales bacterium]